MGFLLRRILSLALSAALIIFLFKGFALWEQNYQTWTEPSRRITRPVKWKDIPVRYPVASVIPLPSGTPVSIPRIQHDFRAETENNWKLRKERLDAVKEAFLHSWRGYKKHAWLQDEVTPISGGYKNDFGRRGATLVDTLDTLLIMGLDEEFELAVLALKKIDFTTTEVATLNVFETTIRYLGGLLSAYDLSEGNHDILLEKAVELGDMLYVAFDTPNRLPITRWDWVNGALHGEQEAPDQALSAELGSLSLEFTRLSQITGDPKYYDAIQRVTNQFEKHQNSTSIPGLWPIILNPHWEMFNADRTFTFGGMSDSLYEYFPKEYMLLGGLVDQYRTMYEHAIEAAKKHLFFRPLNPQNQDILLSGTSRKNAADLIRLDPVGQHLTCFTGGMVGIGAKIFGRPDDLDIAKKLVDGCIWAYDSMPTGIMPELFSTVACKDPSDCKWSTQRWHDAIMHDRHIPPNTDIDDIIKEFGLAPGFTEIKDRRFLLRPEAIESVFILYRITGAQELQDAAWRMFQSIQNSTQTLISNAAIADVTTLDKDPQKLDSCESFWTAETLKYFYLIFSDPDVISLDEWVFNTEAHPLRRPQRD
jgi:mannosyl-oligosaccharide alpha-1,2-mannosidase